MRTLAWTDDLPLCSVPSLAALACQQGDGRWWTLLPLKGYYLPRRLRSS